MGKRRLVWGAWLVFTVLLYLFENNTGTRTLLIAGVLVPSFSALCAALAAKRVSLYLKLPASAEKRKDIPCSLCAEGSPLLVFTSLAASIAAQNLLSTTESRYALTFSGGSKPEKSFSLSSACCGTLRMTVEKAVLQDVFGLFAFPVATPAPLYLTVASELLSVRLNITESTVLGDSNERWSQTRPGSDPSETFAIREYMPGDPIRQIHWKLSQKADKLMIRELGLPVTDDILLLLETSLSPDCRPEDTPAAAEALLSVSRELTEEGIPHRIGWRNAALQETEFAEVLNGEDHRNARDRLLAAESEPGDESVARCFLRDSERFYAHTAVFSARPDTDVVSLLGGGRVTLLLPEGMAASSYEQIHLASFPYAGETAGTLYLEL